MDQLHKEVMCERKDEMIFKKTPRKLPGAHFIWDSFRVVFIYYSDELPGAGSVLYSCHECCVQSVTT